MQYEAHITDDYQRDALVIQVREVKDGHTWGLAYAVEDTDEMPTLRVKETKPDEAQRDVRSLEPTPGIRVRWDMAVAIAQAVIGHTQAPADPGALQSLKDENDALASDLREVSAELAATTAQATQWEVLCIAKDEQITGLQSHLGREARTSDHFHETLEDERRKQLRAEQAEARAQHPSSTPIQDKINDAFRRMAQNAGNI